jgi:hypothetical protein
MKMGRWAGLLAAATLMAGCGDFWQAPSGGSSFTLTNSASITLNTTASSTGSSTITVTPANSFTGTVALTCAVTSAPTGVSSANYPTCSLSPTSVTISSAAVQSTLTATNSSSPATGPYVVTVYGTSGSTTETTTACVVVGSGSCGSTAGTSGNFYILNSSTSNNTIAGYYISSGKLNAIGSPITVNGIAYAVAIAPNGKFLCVSSSDGVYAYPINSGALGTGVKVTGDLAYALQIDSTDSWLLEAVPILGGGEVTLNAVPINSTNGTFTGATVATASFTVTGATLPQGQMVISPDNNYIFIALETGGTIIVPFNASNPLPSTVNAATKLIGVANTGGSALSVAVDPSSTPRLFYIGETLAGSGGTTGGLRAFDYSSLAGCSGTSCTLTQASGSPIASGGSAPNFILPVATPSYVYVANGVGNITGFAVTGSSSSGYTLTTGSTVLTGAQPAGMALDSTGSYVFEVGSSGSQYFGAYTFDATTTGQLDSQVSSTSPATSIAIVAAP